MMNTTVSFHNVTELEVKEIKHFGKDKDSKEFYTRHLYVTDASGNVSEITLFADNRSALIFI